MEIRWSLGQAFTHQLSENLGFEMDGTFNPEV